MGLGASKADREETIAKDPSKESQPFDNPNPTVSKDESMLARSQHNLKVNNLSTTPRTKHSQQRAAMGAQSRVDRQLASGSAERRDDVTIQSHHINDDQVHVNLAMADLMAYLQVVANNSNNLPLTRRDDPELGRMVSTLTAEEYARKSAAFVPADVRVIGGSFTKYGRVWDLPTSEEYSAVDGAQEPGTSS
jgi:hypothetical protein